MDRAARVDQASRFLQALFGGCNLWFYLWSLKDGIKKTHWYKCSDWQQAALEGVDLSVGGHHVYVGVSLRRQSGSERERVKSEASESIVALWAEVDFGSNGHKKKNLPPTCTDAVGLLEAMPRPPSLVVCSGGGVYGWWLFKEPWIFETPAERQNAADMANGWNVTLLRKIHDAGWEGDNVGDLARVLRLPGTLNWKHDPPLDCALAEEKCAWDRRDDPCFFEEWSICGQPEEVHLGPEVHTEENGDVTQAVLDVATLGESKKKVRQTWEKRRSDLKDSSDSGYDYELARLLIEADWNDQAVANALIGFRRKNGGKKVAAQYYRRTIARARAFVEKGGATLREAEQRSLRELIAAVRSNGDGHDDHVSRLAAAISRKLGGEVKVLRAVRYEAENQTAYKIWVETAGGEVNAIDLGNVDGVLNQGMFRSHVFNATGCVPQKLKAGWEWIAQALWAMCEQETIYEATSNGQVEEWLDDYLQPNRLLHDRSEGCKLRTPWAEQENGQTTTYFFIDRLRQHLIHKRSFKINTQDLGKKLRGYGCINDKINVEIDGKRTSRRAWWRVTESSGLVV